MKKEINIEIGRRIRQRRESLGLTREALAEQSELSVPFLSEVELGRKGASALTIKKLCEAMHTSADYLICGREISTDFPEIIGILSTLDNEYIPLVEELLIAYAKSIKLKKPPE